ncbi:hypothetical protein CPB86DRAFT_145986 [Serendipita vermifera]|nr:hypothetical protein CPB86DRAFT_145986 [Serendipita vermifera]
MTHGSINSGRSPAVQPPSFATCTRPLPSTRPSLGLLGRREIEYVNSNQPSIKKRIFIISTRADCLKSPLESGRIPVKPHVDWTRLYPWPELRRLETRDSFIGEWFLRRRMLFGGVQSSVMLELLLASLVLAMRDPSSKGSGV